MRDLPPPPDDVIRFDAECVAGAARSGVGWWIFAPGVQSLTYQEFEALHSQFLFAALELLTQTTSTALSLNACRSVVLGAAGYVVRTQASPNNGAWSGDMAANVAAGITWVTGEHYRGGHPVTYLPAFPRAFTDDFLRLNGTGFNALRTQGPQFLHAINASNSGAVVSCSLGCLHRSKGGVPLPASEFAPFFGAEPSLVISHQDRRLQTRARGRF